MNVSTVLNGVITEENFDEVFSIIRACHIDRLRRGKNNWERYDEKKVLGMITDSSVYLYHDVKSGEPIGTFTLDVRPSSYYNTQDYISGRQRGSRALYLTTLGVHPDYQKRGHGSKILEFAINEAQLHGYDYLRLEALSGESDFYTKLGFQVRQTRFVPEVGYSVDFCELEI